MFLNFRHFCLNEGCSFGLWSDGQRCSQFSFLQGGPLLVTSEYVTSDDLPMSLSAIIIYSETSSECEAANGENFLDG